MTCTKPEKKRLKCASESQWEAENALISPEAFPDLELPYNMGATYVCMATCMSENRSEKITR